MKRITKNAYAKINLTLEILDKRPDGYHNIKSVMQKISLCDILTFDFDDSGRIFLECSKDVCAMADNLAYKAAEKYLALYFEKTGKTFGANIYIEKHIPDKAGLAGGSADCACVLDCLFEQFGGLDYNDLEEIAASLGSDINFCLDKYKAALCTDRGIVLEKCSPFVSDNILVCVPNCGMKTSEIYKAFDASPVFFREQPSEKVRDFLNCRDYASVLPLICNSFSPICEKQCPDIAEIKDTMLVHGANAAEMSGSGSSVFGIFDDGEKMNVCMEALSEKYKNCFVCSAIAE